MHLKTRRILAVCAACAAAGAPATASLAATGHADDGELGRAAARSPRHASTVISASLADAAHRRAERQVMRLAHRRAHLRRRHVRRAYERRVRAMPVHRLLRERHRLRRSVKHLRRTGGAPDVAIPGALAAIAACESGGDPRAVGGGGSFRGKYQFDYGTWARVGGSGDPAAAPEAEQDRRANMLYARAGSSAWPVCGG
jgi:Transglycosylase-like domain